ncbi:hypothetical protein BUALT_Bualt12G0115400 [Buddleja alternifolia]|uniref:DUF7731 domain-containing protein n=1 Tax=Buddleja alternifolia TaxID=168488 RepID=A0AAV6WYY4_9LAMI|nr:hypothetical protein BUALT_Bualt12G0115400 [Buddleja alternifolia]
MAFSATIKHLLLVSALVYIIFATSKFGRALENPSLGAAGVVAYEYLPEAKADEGESDHNFPEDGVEGTNPDDIFNKAIECFNDEAVYKSCDEAQRLTQSGELHVPPEYTDQYCDGPCLIETHHLLECIDGIMKHFVFYNRATLKDIQETIDTGCSYGPKRGDFDVAEHIETDEAISNKMSSSVVLYTFVVIIIGWHVLLY